MPLPADDALGSDQRLQNDALFLGRGHLLGAGRHLLTRTSVKEAHLLHPQSQKRPGRIDGAVASADDRRPPAEFTAAGLPEVGAQVESAGLLGQGHLAQEVHRLHHPG